MGELPTDKISGAGPLPAPDHTRQRIELLTKLEAAERYMTRLLREREAAQRERDELRAENERMDKLIDKLILEHEQLDAENERLRAALVQIENWVGKLPSNMGEAALVFDYIDKACEQALGPTTQT